MRIPFRLVDVFTHRPLAGNQLCVVPDPVDLPPDSMQAIAKEIGFSETTFVTAVAHDRYAMRIFTPTVELGFAGHPSLGTAFVLVSEGWVGTPATQSVAAGDVPMEVDVDAGWARMRQFPPTFGDEVSDRDGIAAALGLDVADLHPELPSQVVSTGLAHLVIPAMNSSAVVKASPDPRALAALLEPLGTGELATDGCYLFALQGSKAKARMFTSDAGIGEDPATGSAAGPLGAYLAERGLMSPGRIEISQGAEIGRPSTLEVDVARSNGTGSWEIWVGGGVVAVASGHFDLPF
jgi:trans-2,3-dihydro-3-hydroxyanthranilate isomerase